MAAQDPSSIISYSIGLGGAALGGVAWLLKRVIGRHDQEHAAMFERLERLERLEEQFESGPGGAVCREHQAAIRTMEDLERRLAATFERVERFIEENRAEWEAIRLRLQGFTEQSSRRDYLLVNAMIGVIRACDIKENESAADLARLQEALKESILFRDIGGE